MSNNLPLILIILDGWGISKPNKGNAIALAKTPFFDYLTKTYPSTSIYAHGKHVGLPGEQDGNSEAGHMNIGAGRIVEQESIRINAAIKNGIFFKNHALMSAISHVKKNKSKLHILGLASGVMSPHSNPTHLKALLKLTSIHDIKDTFLHLFTDGRDSSPRGSLRFISSIERDLLNGKKRIGTIMGRYFGMDRKKNWTNTELAYNSLVLGEGSVATSPQTAITQSYNAGTTDEFINPHVMTNNNKKLPRIDHNDAVIFFNLRSDRARQLTKCFTQNDFNKKNPNSFRRKKVLNNLNFIAMTDFGPDLSNVKTAFHGVELKGTLPIILKEKTQLYLAETEKYAHVTYFFNGGYKKPLNGEKWKAIASPKIKHYDEVPAMSSVKLTKLAINNLKHQTFKLTKKREGKAVWHYDFTLLNYASPDMIGHTGNLNAGIKSCEIIDKCLKKITKNYLKMGGTVVITADHGNIEEMLNLKTNEIITKHSNNQVPFIIANNKLKNAIKLKKNGCLGNISPTILDLLNTEKPKEMTSKTLILRNK